MSTAPVFVVGCPRSGTTWLYHILLSSGDFAIYRSETHVFNLLAPKFGQLATARDRRALLEAWLESEYLGGGNALDEAQVRWRVETSCRSPGDFLRAVMETMAEQQRVTRWAECTPHHVLHVQEIKRQIPDAIFLHIIRDGRDAAMSMVRCGWAHRVSWSKMRPTSLAALQWQWMVTEGRRQGRALTDGYHEVRYEDLVLSPRDTLARLRGVVGKPLDWEAIQAAGIGSVSKPSSAFGNRSGDGEKFLGRWKRDLSADEILEMEQLVGNTLTRCGYPLSTQPNRVAESARALPYRLLLPSKHWLKTRTPLGRLARTSMRSGNKVVNALPTTGTSG